MIEWISSNFLNTESFYLTDQSLFFFFSFSEIGMTNKKIPLYECEMPLYLYFSPLPMKILKFI